MNRCSLPIALLLVATIAGGCGRGAETTEPPRATTASPNATSSPGGASTDPATSAVAPSPGATEAGAPASPSGAGTDDTPPVARLAPEGGDPVAAQIGSWTWLDTGSDAPWLTGSPITVGLGEPMSVDFQPPSAVASWRARYVPARQSDAAGARPLGEGQGAPAFAAPPSGHWSVEVRVEFAEDGSASYFWQVDVR